MKKLNDAKERNKEIVVMVNTAYELKTIVEEASNMVIYQGIILDRIIYNTYQSRHHIERWNRELVETQDDMTGVKLPVKLEKLSVEFYEDKDFVLDNSKRI